MIKIFTEISHYDSSKRGFLNDILRPFLPTERLEEFGIDNGMIKLVDHIEDSDICLLPMAWNYYLNTNQINKAKELIKKAQTGSKKILDFHIGLTQDSFISLQIKNRKLWEEYFSFPGFIKNLTSHLIKRID